MWLELLEMRESKVKSVYILVPYVAISTPTLGKKLASPINRREPRAKAPENLRQECQQEYIQRREGSPFSKIGYFSATVTSFKVTLVCCFYAMPIITSARAFARNSMIAIFFV